MALEKPVLCYLRADLLDLYVGTGLIEADEIPLINCSPANVKETLHKLAMQERSHLQAIGRRGRAYVAKHHSLESVGQIFDAINRSLGVKPAMARGKSEQPS
jgi:hypothetical protein